MHKILYGAHFLTDTLRGAIPAASRHKGTTGTDSAVPRSTSQPGWTQRCLPSMDTEDFETIHSSAEELSNSSDGEDESSNKNVSWVKKKS
ncbi:unnamed protein product [Oncorhynchus mykiss]|uniref:Uncharacterized protein n=1 Tax=Oncorhynchus mykiss TaxID=8022 RepID=A0A060XKF0_ONCMY|nr:unnamed protein product [Oncorhynchus mykiss]